MANNIKGITIELGGNTENLNSALKGVNKTAGELQSELKQIQRQLKFNPGNTELLNQKAKVLKESISATEKKLKDLKSVQGQVEKQFENGDLGEEKYRAFQRELEQTEDKLKSLKKQAADFGSVAGQKFQVAGEKIKNTGDKINGVGQELTPISAAAAGVGAAAVKAADDFETGMAKVSTIADTTQAPIEQLKQSVMDLSNQTGISTSELTDGLYQTISAGVQTKDAMNVLGVAVKTAKGGFTDTSTAIDTLTSAMNAYHMKASDANKISDTLIATQNIGKTTVGELGQSLGNVIPTAAAAGVKFTDLMGSIAELTKQGMPTSEAITGIKTAISNVIKPSSEASKTAKTLGLNFSEAHMKNVGLPAFLQEVYAKTGGNITVMGKLFGSVEGLNAVTALTGKNQKDFAKTLDGVGKSAGTTNQAFQKMDSTGATSAKKALNSMKNAAAKLGEALAPIAEKIASIISQVAKKLQALSPAQQQMIAKALLLTAALAPMLAIGGQIIKVIGSFTVGIGSVIKGITRFHTTLKEGQGLFAALKTAIGPGGIALLVIAAIAAIVIAIKHLWDTNKGFRDWVTNAWNTIKSLATTVGNGIKGAFVGAVNAIKSAWSGITGFFSGIWSGIQGVFSAVGSWFSSVFSAAWSGIQSAWAGVTGFFSGIWSGITSVFGGAAGWFGNIFSTAWSGITNIWSAATGFFSGVWSGISGAFSATKSWFGSTFGDAWNAIKSAWNNAGSWFGGVWGKIKGAFKPDTISSGFKTAWDNTKSAWSNAGSWFDGIWKSIKDGFKKLNPFQWGEDLMNNFIDGIKSKIEDLKGAVSNVGNTIKSHLHFSEPDEGPLVGFSTWMPDMMEGIRQGILNNMSKVTDAVNQVAATMTAAVPILPDSSSQVRTAMAAAYGGYSTPVPVGGNRSGTSNNAPQASGDVKVYQYFQGKTPSPAEHARLTRNSLQQIVKTMRK